MPTRYPYLPGVNLELLDGELQIDQTITGPVTLVIGRADSGPSNFQYLMSDSNVASAIYGSSSTLMKMASQAKMGGSKNIVLYRIGGSAAELVDVFGADTLLATKEETSVAGSKYSVYIGPEPSTPAKACIIIFEGDKIVYSDVTGSEVDLGLFNIVGFDKDTFVYRVGTPTLPETFSGVLTAVKADATLSTAGDASTTGFDLPATDGTTVITTVTVDSVVMAETTDYSLSVGTGTLGVDEIEFVAAPGAAEAIEVAYTNDVTIAGATYSSGGDSTSASLQALYELLDTAYADLETTVATEVIVDPAAILDAQNIADGSVATDKLDYLYKLESFGEVTYEWGTDQVLYDDGASGTTPTVGLAATDDNGQPIISKRFNEVNFVHQFGTWCHKITEDERFVLGVIGTSVPVANTTSAVAKWIGTLPQTDLSGTIISDGSGLLGNKFMAGSTIRGAGFYFTDSGFPDGNAQADSNGTIIDIGKYISVVMGAINTPEVVSAGSSAQIGVNGAAMYCGLLSTITAGNSTTNEVLPRVGLPYTIKKTKLNELSKVGFVSFQSKTRGVVVVSGELATADASDYDYVSTSIIVRSIISAIRERLEPYIGKGLTQVTIAAANTAVENIFQDAVSSGAINKYAFSVLEEVAVNGRGTLRIPITIVPAFELREVNVSLKLAYDI